MTTPISIKNASDFGLYDFSVFCMDLLLKSISKLWIVLDFYLLYGFFFALYGFALNCMILYDFTSYCICNFWNDFELYGICLKMYDTFRSKFHTIQRNFHTTPSHFIHSKVRPCKRK